MSFPSFIVGDVGTFPEATPAATEFLFDEVSQVELNDVIRLKVLFTLLVKLGMTVRIKKVFFTT